MRYLGPLALAVLVCACGTEGLEESEGEFRDPSGQVDPSKGRGVGEYAVRLNIASHVAQNLMMAFGGWACSASASLHYSEDQADHQGRTRTLFHEQSSSFVWMGASSVSLSFTRDYSHSNPRVYTEVSEYCAKTTSYPCTRYDENNEPYSDTCSKTDSFLVSWRCQDPYLPNSPGSSRTVRCTQKGTSWVTPSIEAYLVQALVNLEISTTTTLLSQRVKFDYNNCSATNGEPFYLRLTQGLGGRSGENDFILHARIDGEELSFPSTTGLYTLALAYCPPSDRDSIRLDLRGVEDDMIWDDLYTPAPGMSNLSLQRGTSRQIVLLRKHLTGTKESRVLVEAFQ